MYSHVTIGANDFEQSKKFYDAILSTLSIKQFWCDNETTVGYGEFAGPHFWILKPHDKSSAHSGNGTMTAFNAPSRDIVDAFHKAALAQGGSDEGTPGLRTHYHPNYYGCYVRDPEGNKLCCVCHSSKG